MAYTSRLASSSPRMNASSPRYAKAGGLEESLEAHSGCSEEGDGVVAGMEGSSCSRPWHLFDLKPVVGQCVRPSSLTAPADEKDVEGYVQFSRPFHGNSLFKPFHTLAMIRASCLIPSIPA